jgi:hypothetical protein
MCCLGHYVKGHYTKSGKYVEGHDATNPDRTHDNNYSTKRNVNPHTHEPGTKKTFSND